MSSPELFKRSLHSENLSNIFDEPSPLHEREQSDESYAETTLRLSQLAVAEQPRTPGAGVVYRGSMKSEEPDLAPDAEEPVRQETSSAGSSKEGELVLERDRLRSLNNILEGSITTFTVAQGKMQVHISPFPLHPHKLMQATAVL